MTAVGALAGTLIGLLTTGLDGAAPTVCCGREIGSDDVRDCAQVLSVTAGGFLYIAMTSVLPALLLPATTAQSVIEVAAIVTGVALMIVVALLE
jgi:zinc transporter 7